MSSIHFPLQFPLWILISFVSFYANEDTWTNKSCTTQGIQLRRFSFALTCQYYFVRTSKALSESCSGYLRRSLIQNPRTQDLHWFPSWNLSYCHLLCNTTLNVAVRMPKWPFKRHKLCTVAIPFACFTNTILTNRDKIWLLLKEIRIKHITFGISFPLHLLPPQRTPLKGFK